MVANIGVALKLQISQRTKSGTFARHTKPTHKSQPCKRACLVPTLPGHTLLCWTHTFNSSYQDEGRTHNREFAAMLADEYILSFISLSAHIQPTEFYQLLLLSSSSVFQSVAAPGWTFNEYQHSSKLCPLDARLSTSEILFNSSWNLQAN